MAIFSNSTTLWSNISDMYKLSDAYVCAQRRSNNVENIVKRPSIHPQSFVAHETRH